MTITLRSRNAPGQAATVGANPSQPTPPLRQQSHAAASTSGRGDGGGGGRGQGRGRGSGRPPQPSGVKKPARTVRALVRAPPVGGASGTPTPTTPDPAARSLAATSPALHAFAVTAPFWVPAFAEAAREGLARVAAAVGVEGAETGPPFPAPPPSAWSRLDLGAAAASGFPARAGAAPPPPGGGYPPLLCLASGDPGTRPRRARPPVGAPALNFLPGTAAAGGGALPGAAAYFAPPASTARPGPVRAGGPGRAVALGPGGGRALVPGRDVLITLAFSSAAAGAGGGGGRLLAELVCLPSATLASLRDAFTAARLCPSDAALAALGRAVPGACLHVEGVIYEDDRAVSGGGPSYGAPIVGWAAGEGLRGPPPPVPGGGQEAGPPVAAPPARPAGGGGRRAPPQPPPPHPPRPPFRAGAMTTAGLGWVRTAGVDGEGATTPTPLRAGGGAGACFTHQGGCEHAVAVRDVRLAAPGDAAAPPPPGHHHPPPPTTGDFPLLTFRARPAKKRACSLCGTARAAKVTSSDPHAPAAPAFWCAPCYEAFHYGRDGRLLYDHRVADYHGG